MEYKYWDIINIPGRKSEGAKTSAPSLADATVLSVGNVEPSIVDKVKEAVSTEAVIDIASEELKEIKEGPSSETEYVSPDDVDYTKYDTPSENVETTEENLGEDFEFDKETESSDEKQDEIIDAIKRVEEKVDGVKNDKYVTMDQLTALFDSVAGEKKKPVTTELDEHEVAEVLRTFEKFQAKYFPELPIRNEICKRFLFNIPRRVYDTHIAVCECYSDPDIFDPLFWLLLCFTECKREDVALFISAIDRTLTNCEEETSNTLVNLIGDVEEDEEEEDEETVDVDVTVEDVEE